MANTLKIKFELEVGFIGRERVGNELRNSKAKLEHWYPGCRVLLTESRGWLETTFYFEACNLPESAGPTLKAWKARIEEIVD